EILHPLEATWSEISGKPCNGADPINCATGNYFEQQADITIPGLGVGLNLARTYNARAAAMAGSPGPFRFGWSSSFSDHLLSEEEGKRLTLVDADGSTEPFLKAGAGFQAPPWSQDSLTGSVEAGYVVLRPDQTEYGFSSSGRLESVTDRNG